MLGQTISHYKITAKLGEGGMGAVYCATDARLGREVALKILPERFVRDRQRMGRFQREAEILASLNHPHINIVHGLEEADGVLALVLELVEGPTLAERIAEGPIPVEEALRMALEIAQALEAAHEKGIIHRDLKPSNVKITAEGGVKVLDFGLAKALESEVSEQELAQSPTLTLEATQEGMVLGTAAYMSPEQARGQVVDKRSDIWSFGLVLFEMLTGKGMFAGKSFTETLAAVIHQERTLEELPRETPRKIRELVERCLRKDPRIRLRDVGDARITIGECLTGSAVTSEKAAPAAPARPAWRRLAPWAAVPLMAAMAWSARPDSPIPAEQVTRFEVPLAENEVIYDWNRHALALSPDGTKLAFVSGNEESKTRIYIRSFDRWEAIRVPDAEYLIQPFFSPDGDWLGFSWATSEKHRKLKKYPLDGGPITTICDCSTSRPFGASWAVDDTIVFSCDEKGGLWRVSPSGGEPEQITELDQKAHEVSHRLPHLLPGGKEVLYTVMRYGGDHWNWSHAQIVVESLETGEKRALIEGASDARYIPTGHLVFAREATLWAVPFDLATLTVTGPEVPVLEGVNHVIGTGHTNDETGAAQFAFSESGTLAYVSGSVRPQRKLQLVWVSRGGQAKPLGVELLGASSRAVLSPDESTVAFAKNGNIWTYDLERKVESIQTVRGFNFNPSWGPDGRSITFTSNRKGRLSLFRKVVESSVEAEQLSVSENDQHGGCWSQDGKRFAFVQYSPKTLHDIWVLSMEGSRLAEPFLETPFYETHPAFSPNGRWLAYASDHSGKREVYLLPYPGPGGERVRISPNGGSSPAWSGSGRELFYREGPRLMSVEITAEEGELRVGNPVVLFEGNYASTSPIRSYDVTPNGQRFLRAVKPLEKESAEALSRHLGNKVNVVLNWFEELKRLAPTDN